MGRSLFEREGISAQRLSGKQWSYITVTDPTQKRTRNIIAAKRKQDSKNSILRMTCWNIISWKQKGKANISGFTLIYNGVKKQKETIAKVAILLLEERLQTWSKKKQHQCVWPGQHLKKKKKNQTLFMRLCKWISTKYHRMKML